MKEKKIKPRDLERLLRRVHLLTPKQREYIHGKLSDGADYGGMTKRKVAEKLRDIKHEVPGKVNRFVAGKVEKAVLGEFEEPEESESEE